MITVTRRSRSGRLPMLATASAILTGALTFGAAWVIIPSPAPVAGVTDPAARSSSTEPGEIEAGFATVPDTTVPAKVLSGPPADAVITLVSFHQDFPPITPGSRAPWWISSVPPRIPDITQFDRGDLATVNCTMAAGAMLARMAYGIETSGSQLRRLSGSTTGGTGFGDLNIAMRKGWKVAFARGWLTPVELRALLWSGAGAAIHVNYRLIDKQYSQQPGFTGGHSIYLDGFRADGPTGAEYFVMDPLGLPWRSYKGEWWPADMVERAGVDFGGGRIITAWAYPGGTRLVGAPPRLPVEAYPTESHKPGQTQTPVNPPTPEPDTGTGGTGQGQGAGNAPNDQNSTPSVPSDPGPVTNGSLLGAVSVRSLLSVCVVAIVRPAFCPIGLAGDYPIAVPRFSPPPLFAPLRFDMLFSDSPQPGIERAIFSGPPGIDPTLSYWPSANGSSGPVSQALVEEATLNSQPVWIATFPVSIGSYQFVASGSASWGAGISQVASVVVGAP